MEVVYRGVSWPRARCEQLEPDDFRALRVASLKVIVFLSLESRGDFEGRVEVFVGGFSFLFFFFSLTRMKDAREYIARVKLFDAFVKFVYLFLWSLMRREFYFHSIWKILRKYIQTYSLKFKVLYENLRKSVEKYIF